MNRYTYRRELERGSFKTWEYEYVVILAHELPERPSGFTLFTITKL